MNNISIKVKLLSIITLAIILMAVILASGSIYTISKLSKENIAKYEEEAFSSKKEELKNYVSFAYNIVEDYHSRTKKEKIQAEVESYLEEHTNSLFTVINAVYEKNKNKMSKKELFKKIKTIVAANRYGKNGYFFAYDTKGTCQILDVKKQLEGVNQINVKDSNGVYVIREVVQAGLSEKGSGFISYLWPKPGIEKPQPKVSYAKLFKPLNLVIGTGTYVDDVSSAMKEEALKNISKVRYGGNGYFWINDMDSVMVMHPIKKSLNGKSFKGNKNVQVIDLAVKALSNSATGSENIEYTFYNPATKKDGLKISNVALFKPWNWVIGTGVYVTDIEKNVAAMKEQATDEINNIIWGLIIEVIVAVLIMIVLMGYITNNLIFKPLESFQDGLLSFFKYLNRETNDVKLLDESKNDEIGVMSKAVNQNIISTKNGIEEDRKLIDETITVLGEFEQGDLCQRLDMNVSNPALMELKSVLNKMGENMESNIDNVLNILEQYSSYNYLNKIDKTGLKEHLLSLANGVNTLGDSITSMLVENKSNGLTLGDSSTVLLSNVDVLNKNSNDAASALEETAAALEQITSNISNNTDNVVRMSGFAGELTKSAKEGEDLAQKTTVSMDEINTQVTAINEAITVIDQIAFQTNILSLNAAVEAATAGEAGKGFAVVAGEVRNLAARSAEAASEIKTLVENATSKANDGKNIADKMIEGYNGLNSNISKTLDLIKGVEMASKEQLSGINQINDAITSLDEQTQQNAMIATQTNDVAVQTDEIAKLVVSNANAKEFKGKNEVQAKTQNTPIRTEAPRKARQTKTQKPSLVKATSSNDEWENF